MRLVLFVALAACSPSSENAPVDMAKSPPSAACMTFCQCMAMNCADKMFPHNCLDDCAAQTNWDMPCRMNMCSLVPAQPNNDHCTHAMGVDQCLDK